jgi:hypothetical protein
MNPAALIAMIRNLDGQFCAQCQLVEDAFNAEREACAKVADPIEHSGPWTDVEKQAYDVRTVIAAAIRNRQQ